MWTSHRTAHFEHAIIFYRVWLNIICTAYFLPTFYHPQLLTSPLLPSRGDHQTLDTRTAGLFGRSGHTRSARRVSFRFAKHKVNRAHKTVGGARDSQPLWRRPPEGGNIPILPIESFIMTSFFLGVSLKSKSNYVIIVSLKGVRMVVVEMDWRHCGGEHVGIFTLLNQCLWRKPVYFDLWNCPQLRAYRARTKIVSVAAQKLVWRQWQRLFVPKARHAAADTGFKGGGLGLER